MDESLRRRDAEIRRRSLLPIKAQNARRSQSQDDDRHAAGDEVFLRAYPRGANWQRGANAVACSLHPLCWVHHVPGFSHAKDAKVAKVFCSALPVAALAAFA
jgi:hypothetical protein